MSSYPWILEFGAADVVLNAGEMNAVHGAPLFLCPAAQKASVGINAHALVKEVRAAELDKVLAAGSNLGRQAISHVIECRPTLYQKALDTCNLLNWYNSVKRDREELLVGPSDIIVCAFRIRDFSKLCAALELDDAKVAKLANVPLAQVQSLTGNYRLHFAPVLKIFEALKQAALALAPAEGEIAELDRVRRKNLRESIVVDRKPFVNIQKLGPDDANHDYYVLNEVNVGAAPTSGHPWAWPQPDS